MRGYLAVFSTAAPLFSLLTYALLNGYHFETPQHIWTGLVLLFSAGSFLYVATIHVLPEIISGHSHGSSSDLHTHSQRLTPVCPLLEQILTPMLLKQTLCPLLDAINLHSGRVNNAHVPFNGSWSLSKMWVDNSCTENPKEKNV